MLYSLYLNLLIALGLFPLIVGLSKFRKLDKSMRLLLLLLGISFLTDLYSRILGIIGISNLHIFHYYTLIEYTLLAMIFSHWQENRLIVMALRISIPVFYLIWIIAKYSFEEFNKFDNYTTTLEGIILLIASTKTLYSLINNGENEAIKDYRFWVSSAVLLYFAGNIILFSTSKVITHTTWMTIHSTSLIISNYMYLKGYLCRQKI